MRILVTNDDGTGSPGLWQLVRAMAEVGETVVAAPNRDMSGSAAAMMLKRPVRVRELKARGRGGLTASSVSAPPASCVLLALRGAIPGGPFDLVVSGINSGANVGRDALLSGTVGAALVAAMEGIPALAVSILRNAEDTWDWPTAAGVAARLARKIRDEAPAEKVLLNVNLPALPGEKMAGVRLTHLSRDCCLARLSVQAHEARPGTYRFRTERLIPRGDDVGSDEWSIANGFVSLTALTPDIGYVRDSELLSTWLADLLPGR